MKFGESLYWIIIILNILGGMIPYNHQPTECSEHCSNDSEISLERDLARSVCVACVFFSNVVHITCSFSELQNSSPLSLGFSLLEGMEGMIALALIHIASAKSFSKTTKIFEVQTSKGTGNFVSTVPALHKNSLSKKLRGSIFFIFVFIFYRVYIRKWSLRN